MLSLKQFLIYQVLQKHPASLYLIPLNHLLMLDCVAQSLFNTLQALGVKFLDLDASVTIEDMKEFNIIPVTIGLMALQSLMGITHLSAIRV